VLQETWEYKYLFGIKISSPLGIYPEEELLDHMVVLFLEFFLIIFILFSIMAILIYIPTYSVQEFPSSPAFIPCLFDNNHTNWGEMMSYCDFYLYFSDD
jgi:hypothetical protein